MISAILIDQREPSWIHRLSFGGALKSIAMLDAGDVHLVTDSGELLVLERKTPDDLLGSIKDNRLFAQCAGMKKLSPWSYVVVTGVLQCGPKGTVISPRGETGWSWNSVQGALLSIQELGVFVLSCNGNTDFERAVMCLADRKRDLLMRVMPSRLPVTVGRDLAILSDFPNIGLDRAEKLLDHCGTLGWALTALTDGVAVPGIGEVTKKLARATLGLKDDEQLQIVTKTGGNDVQTSG